MAAKATKTNVARLTTEEQISYLFHQYEGFADWRLLVEDRLKDGEEATIQLNNKVDNVEHNLDQLSKKVDSRVNEVLLVQQQILIAVQGQRIPGLESPGITDRMSSLETKLHKSEERETVKDARIQALEEFKFRILVFVTGFGALLGGAAWKIAPYLTQILTILH